MLLLHAQGSLILRSQQLHSLVLGVEEKNKTVKPAIRTFFRGQQKKESQGLILPRQSTVYPMDAHKHKVLSFDELT
jgi:hypothetical protein